MKTLRRIATRISLKGSARLHPKTAPERFLWNSRQPNGSKHGSGRPSEAGNADDSTALIQTPNWMVAKPLD